MTATLVAEERSCPKCGGRTWDNRIGKKNPKAPDFKCRDKSCDGVIWPPKGNAAPVRQAPVQQTAPAADPASPDPVWVELERGEQWLELRAKYMESLTFVLKHVVPELVKANIGASPESVSAMTAQIFIARNDRGI